MSDLRQNSVAFTTLFHLIIVPCAEKDWDECQPYDASAVHSESDVFGFVEVFGNLAGFEGVPSAHENQHHVVNERHHQGEG